MEWSVHFRPAASARSSGMPYSDRRTDDRWLSSLVTRMLQCGYPSLVKCRALSTCDSGLPDSVSKIEHLRCEHRHSAAKGMRAAVLPVVVLILYIYLTCWVAPVLARASRCSEVPHLILAVQGRRNDIAAHLFVRSSVGLVFTGSTCRMVSAIHAGHRDLASSPHSHRTLPPHPPTAPSHRATAPHQLQAIPLLHGIAAPRIAALPAAPQRRSLLQYHNTRSIYTATLHMPPYHADSKRRRHIEREWLPGYNVRSPIWQLRCVGVTILPDWLLLHK